MIAAALPPPLRPTRLQVGLWLVLIVAMLIAVDFDAAGALSIDGSHYLVLAESLRSGPAFTLLSRAPVASNADLPLSPFPWGYPLVLSPLVAAFPGRLDLLGLPSLAATLINSCLIFWGWRWLGRGSYWLGLAVAGLYGLSPLTTDLANRVFSEAVFTTFLLASIIAIEVGVRRLPARLPAWWQPLTAALLVLMVFTRTAGWAMLAGLCGYVLIRRRRAGLRPLAMIAAWMAVWTACVVYLTPVSGRDLLPIAYARQLQGIVAGNHRSENDRSLSYPRTLLNLANRRLYRDIPSAVAPGLASRFTRVLAARWGLEAGLPWLGRAISLLLLVGFVQWARRDGVSAFLLAAAPYLLALLGWRVLGPRLLYPLQPQLFYALLCGLTAILPALGPLRRLAWRRRALAVAGGALICLYAVISVLSPADADYARDLEQRGRWLRANTSSAAILMSRLPDIDFVLSRRRGLPYPRTIDAFTPVQFAAFLGAAEVDFLIVEKQTGGWSLSDDDARPQRSYRPDATLDYVGDLAQTLQAQGRLQLRYRAADGFFAVYEVK